MYVLRVSPVVVLYCHSLVIPQATTDWAKETVISFHCALSLAQRDRHNRCLVVSRESHHSHRIAIFPGAKTFRIDPRPTAATGTATRETAWLSVPTRASSWSLLTYPHVQINAAQLFHSILLVDHMSRLPLKKVPSYLVLIHRNPNKFPSTQRSSHTRSLDPHEPHATPRGPKPSKGQIVDRPEANTNLKKEQRRMRERTSGTERKTVG